MSLIHPRNSLESLNMDSATRKKLKSDIEVYLAVFPYAQFKDIRESSESGTTSQLWGNLKKSTKNSFFTRNVQKFFGTESSVQHRGGNSWKKTPRGSQDKKVGHEQTQPEPEGGWIDRGLFRKLTTIDQTILNETFICKT